MERVIGVSWPRSGHHLLVRLLTLYFGEGFLYCDFYGGIENCCKKTPCKRRDVHLSKSHDFDLGMPQIARRKYLIQYRDFIPSVVSNFELHVRNGGADTLENFRVFAGTQFDSYRAFSEKWVQSDFAARQLVIEYDTLQSDPATTLARAVGWFQPDRDPDAARIDQAVARVDGERVERGRVTPLKGAGVHSARRIEDFRHYRPALFATLAAMRLTRPEVKAVFREELGRDPSPENLVNFQASASIDTLRRDLRASQEYIDRQGARDPDDDKGGT
ncbi:hypothetical protein FIU89_21840 (plasmid) [Roseovarius sp. THAF27]|uniref:hypothetical protein n=1 Tax=unclassified Roseovarius TaxID=2614913 RepID=UPI0012689D32|nr:MULTISPECIES: hypothetical protein [unclassified Roseovarius]QFT83279.1 hypothetical protein FIU89_21840 [Roseovarius sp. THAF27]QFT99959.1 hypothetical protein FIU85_21745 [Roseovarius sp. THAF8]